MALRAPLIIQFEMIACLCRLTGAVIFFRNEASKTEFKACLNRHAYLRLAGLDKLLVLAVPLGKNSEIIKSEETEKVRLL